MELGIFAKTFVRTTVEDALDAVQAHGLGTVQFNMACAGLPSMPDRIPAAVCDQIQKAMSVRQLTMAAVSGTYNMAHPNPSQRQIGLQRLAVLTGAAKRIGTSIITLCTGSRDPHNKWRYHPDNCTPEAWRDMAASMESALQIAAEHNVTLAIEPELANVVNSAGKARRLLDDMQSPYLKIVMDAANLFPVGSLCQQQAVLQTAFELLGEHIVVAHAKDLTADGEAGHQAAGTGLLDYDHYLSLLQECGFSGPLILHSLSESQVSQAMAFLAQRLQAVEGKDT